MDDAQGRASGTRGQEPEVTAGDRVTRDAVTEEDRFRNQGSSAIRWIL